MNSRSKIRFPQIRLAHAAVILQLREIDPLSELIYFGAGAWMLGMYKPDDERIRQARKRLGFLTRFGQAPPDYVRFEQLAAEGFRPVETYTIKGEPGGEIVEDFRYRDFMYRNRGDETVQFALESHERQRAMQEKKVDDWIEAKAGDAWRHAFKKPVSVTQN